ncbi:MAG: toll/interleukin-1 receptor domain-containing protein [Gelidibacter sp.]
MEVENVTVLLWDSLQNFNEFMTNWGFYNGESNIYNDVKQFQSEKEFVNKLNDTQPDENLVFCCHVNFGNLKEGYYLFKNSKIEQKFNIPDVYYISSGGDDAENALKKESVGKIIVRQYNDFEADIRLGRIKTFKKDELYPKARVKDKTLKEGIFLSHSSKDRVVVEKFRDLILIQGLGYNINHIKFTSSDITGVKGGISIPQDLKDFLINKNGFFIQFISEDYVKSRVCLNEEGAGWVLCPQNQFLSILIPPASIKSLSWIKSLDKGIKLDNSDSLKKMYFERKSFFDSSKFDELNFTKQVDCFVDWYNSTKPSH